MTTTKRFAFIVYAVTDMARSRDFYEAGLSVKPLNVWGADTDAMSMVEYELGNGDTFALGKGAPNFKPGPNGGVIAFEVDDIAATTALFKGKGAKVVVEAHDSPVCTMAVLSDPDGNTFMLHKKK